MVGPVSGADAWLYPTPIDDLNGDRTADVLVNSKTYGVKMPRLGTDDARRAPFPLAPLEEQRRIVARVDQLMSLCDSLEAGLLRSQADGERLMEVVVGRMLAG